MTSAKLLTVLLEKNARDSDGQFRRGLTNHLPMALVALVDLGATEDRVRAFCARYETRLEPAPTSSRDTALRLDDFAQHLGTHARYADLVALFRGRLEAESPHALARRVLPTLIPGLAGGAFHGLIRVAYALGRDGVVADEVAAALAYMADVHLPLGANASADANERGTDHGRDDTSLRALLDHVSANADARAYVGKRGLIFDDLADVASRSAFSRLLSEATRGTRAFALNDVASAARDLYASTNNFTALHCVTAAHALRVLTPWLDGLDGLDDPERAAGMLARAIVAAHITMSAPTLSTDEELERVRAAALPSWEEIARAACASDDEHVIKIVWTAREEEKAYGDPLYRAIAARAITKS